MILEKADVAALRLSEQRGMFPSDGELVRAGMGGDEYRERLRKLTAAEVIRSFRTILVVPPLLGGDWVWAGVLANVERPLGVANVLAKKLPFVTEIILNSGLPAKLGPNLALLFYSRDFDTEARFIRSVPGLEHHEMYPVATYSFPMALPLSGEEKSLLRVLVATPQADTAALGAAVGKDEDWVRAKLERLLWTENHRSGVVRVQPDVDWTRVSNFGHFHFLLVTGHRPEQLARLTEGQGFGLVMGGRIYRERFVQLEADVWGVADLMERVAFLNQIAGVSVAGVVWNERVLVSAGWAAGLLD